MPEPIAFPAVPRRWFSISASAQSAEVSIFDELGGWGVRASDFKKEFDRVKDKPSLTLLLNSPGGDVFEAQAVASMLRTVRSRLTVKVLGLAASAASIVALAGKRLVMSEGAYLMIHSPWSAVVGNAGDMRKAAALLDQVSQSMASIYLEKSKKPRAEILALMAEETWYDAGQAVEAGFADEVEKAEAIAALADLSRYHYKHTPRVVARRAVAQKQPPATVRDLERTLRDAGLSKSQAMRVISQGARGLAGTAGGTDGTPVSSEEAAETKARLLELGITL